MAQNTTVTIPSRTWTQMTDADITAITFQNLGPVTCMVKATTDATPPTDVSGEETGALRYGNREGERNVAVADLFPGLSGADRLWVYATEEIRMFISHA